MLTNKQAIEYIDSILSNYDNPKEVDRHYPDYRLCEVWLSRYDLEALKMAKDALRKLDTIKEDNIMDKTLIHTKHFSLYFSTLQIGLAVLVVPDHKSLHINLLVLEIVLSA